MRNVTISEITGLGDVDFDQSIDTDTIIASGGGVAVNGSVFDSAVNTGRNDGILAGDDVSLSDSIVGHGNTQVNDSTVGAFAGGYGDATNVTGQNVNMGSGTLLDVDALGDAQVAYGNGNRLTGDVSFNATGVDGPLNLAVGDDNRQNALEDNSTTVDDSFNADFSTEIDDSYNTDNSISDSYDTLYDDSFNTSAEDNDSSTSTVEDSFNASAEDNDSWSSSVADSFNPVAEDNDTTTWDWDSHDQSSATAEDNDSYTEYHDLDEQHLVAWGDDIELDAVA